MKKRYSKKREKILKVFQKGHLMTALEVSKKLSEIDQATVYRNINRFVIEGILKEIKLDRGISHYEIADDNHQHFVCDNCEKIYPIHIEDKVFKEVMKSTDRKVSGIEINLRGKCEKC
ncbi:MAG TPA: transcriptional repressor [Candidatus Dojkabacteria bacterium]|jgi:Fe2+ or Zn2+ uptake regulation protein